MSKKVKAVPEGYHAVTPGLAVSDAAKALEFYRKAFGAKEFLRVPGPGGKIMHAEIRIGDSVVFLSDEFAGMPNACKSPDSLGGSSAGLYLYVEDADVVFAQAVKAGASVGMPVSDMFWGDRLGQVKDPFGHIWSIATHKEDLTPAEIEKRQAAQFGAAVK